MPLKENMQGLGDQLGSGVKSTTQKALLWFLKCFSGAVIGLVVALVGQEIIGYETFSLVFVIVTVTGGFCRISAKWRLASLLIFDLLMVLLALLLRMYVLVAPGV